MKTSLNSYEIWIDRIIWITLILIPLAIIPIDVPDIFDTAKGPILVLSGLSLIVFLILLKKWDKSLIVLLLIIYLGLVFLSSVFAFDPLLAFIGETPRGGRFEGFISILIYGVLFYSSKNYLVITPRKLTIAFSFLSLVSVYALVQYYQYDPLVIYKHFRSMIFATIGNQNFLGSLMVMLSVLSFGCAVLFKKWYYFVFLVFFISSLLASQTRGCWIAFSIVFLLFSVYLFVFQSKIIYSYLLSLSLIVFVAFFLNYTKKNVLSSRSSTIKRELSLSNEYGGSGRLKIWEITIEVIKSNPILGTGPENLKSVLHAQHKKLIDEYYHVKKTSIDKAHSEFLHVAAVTGIPSLLVYVSLIILIFKNRLREIKKLNQFQGIILFAVMGYLFQATFNISVIAVAPVYWILLGYLAKDIKEVY